MTRQAGFFDIRTPLLALEPFFLCRPGNTRRFARAFGLEGGGDQFAEFIDGVVAVHALAAMTVRGNPESAVARDPVSETGPDLIALGVGERNGPSHAEDQRDTGFHAVHVLTTRASAGGRFERDLLVGYLDRDQIVRCLDPHDF